MVLICPRLRVVTTQPSSSSPGHLSGPQLLSEMGRIINLLSQIKGFPELHRAATTVQTQHQGQAGATAVPSAWRDAPSTGHPVPGPGHQLPACPLGPWFYRETASSRSRPAGADSGFTFCCVMGWGVASGPSWPAGAGIESLADSCRPSCQSTTHALAPRAARMGAGPSGTPSLPLSHPVGRAPGEKSQE